MAETAAERDELEALAQRNALALLRRWFPGGQLIDKEYVFEEYAINTGYGGWTVGDVKGKGFVRLRAMQKGWKQTVAAKDIRSALEDLGVLQTGAVAAKKGLKHTPILPVPADAIALDWPALMGDELAWRRLGMKVLPADHYEYRDTNGALLGYAVRFEPAGEPKIVARLLWCGAHGWQLVDFPKPYPLFGLDELVKRPDDPVLLVEGEKTAIAARELFSKYVVVTWPNGTLAVRHVAWSYLRGREVIIWPDADPVGETAALEIAGQLRRYGCTGLMIVELPPTLPRGWDLADAAPDGVDVAALLESASRLNPHIDKLNGRYCVVNDGGNVVVFGEEKDPLTNFLYYQNLSFTDFRNLHCNQEVMVGQDGRGNPIYEKLGDFWLSHPARRQYNGVVYAPDAPTPGFLNLWQGFAVEPKPGDWSLLHRHLVENICDGHAEVAEYVLCWAARAVQRPAEPGQVALVMRGKRGTGKGVFAQALGQLFGSHFQHVSNTKHLIGHFNAHLRHATLVFADEAFWAGDKQGESTLKTLITERRLVIEGKGKDIVTAPNTVHLVVSSNNDWVIPAGLEERRFCVMDVSPKQMQDNAFFRLVNAQLENGGHAALLYDLLNRDIGKFDVYNVPQTEALLEQKVRSLAPELAWWLDLLHEGKLPGDNLGTGRAAFPLLVESYTKGVGKTSIMARGALTKLAMNIPTWIPGYKLKRKPYTGQYLEQVGTDQQGHPKLQKKRGQIYEFPLLEDCRKAFEKLVRQPVVWSEEVVAWQAEAWDLNEPPF